MASELSDYLSNEILDWFKGTDMPTAPTTIYLALFDGDPGPAGSGGTEETTTIRPAGRVAISTGSITSREIANSSIVDFGTAAGAADITHAAVFDASSSGNMLCYSPLTASRSVGIGDSVTVPIGDVTIHFN